MDDQNSPIIELREQVKSQQARIVALSTQFNALLKVLKDNASEYAPPFFLAYMLEMVDGLVSYVPDFTEDTENSER